MHTLEVHLVVGSALDQRRRAELRRLRRSWLSRWHHRLGTGASKDRPTPRRSASTYGDSSLCGRALDLVVTRSEAAP